ncbi:hypothetical protein RYX56_17420 [Alkalihalophilus lindianensis]|uniref:Uncharacterized protein n=1 Tax=Alkalihalophilus lindianensis TaxID=1630542 RepID=A0ABU3XE45_9BACI|nr:hypothetical protein [Alkalihalophilus lindianensis]MDV2686152.1 hypothetical protein [Alkalihalophilus lindianensis]
MNLFFERVKGDVVIESDTKVMSVIEGDIKVLPGAKLELAAPVKGDIVLKRFSKASIGAEVDGTVYDEGASLEVLSDIRLDYKKITK